MNPPLSDRLALKVRNLSVCYWNPATGEPAYALQDIHLDVPDGAFFACTGVSGGGKSTLARALLGLLDGQPGPISGEIHMAVGGEGGGECGPLLSSSSYDRRSLVTRLRSRTFKDWRNVYEQQANRLRCSGSFLLLQEPRDSLHPYLPVGRLLEGCLRRPGATSKGYSVGELLELVELSDRVAGQYPAQLSTGMCQRVHLAMAIASGARLLIADEPLIRLDLRTRRRMTHLLGRVHEAEGFTVLLLSHDLDLIRELATHLAVLRQGRIVEYGLAGKVTTSPRHVYTEALVRTYRVLQERPREPSPGATPRPRGRAPIEIESVRKSFPGIDAVNEVNLRLMPAETLGLLGESGSGKTTLARLVIGLERPEQGTLRIQLGDAAAFHPERLSAWQWRHRRSRVQLVYQDADTALNPRLYAAECVAEAYRIQYPQLKRAQRRQLTASLFQELELPPEKRFTLASNLSGGEARRVNIAQSLAALGFGLDFGQASPDRILIADEPTTGMDAETCLTFIKLLKRCREEMRLSMLIISHDLPVLRHLCQRTAVMFQGRIVETGPPDIIEEYWKGPRHPFTSQLILAGRMAGEEARLGEESGGEALEGGCPFFAQCTHEQRDRGKCSRRPRLEGPEDHPIACWAEGGADSAD